MAGRTGPSLDLIGAGKAWSGAGAGSVEGDGWGNRR